MVERRRRRLLEIDHSLRFEANLPKQYWGECVLTNAYIINRLPSKVLDNKAPYEVLFQKRPNYKIMKVFGCLSNYRNNKTGGENFEMKGSPEIFLGYLTGTKGYKIDDIESKRMIVSRDDCFCENIFPFHKRDSDHHREESFDFLNTTIDYEDSHESDIRVDGTEDPRGKTPTVNNPTHEPDLEDRPTQEHESGSNPE